MHEESSRFISVLINPNEVAYKINRLEQFTSRLNREREAHLNQVDLELDFRAHMKQSRVDLSHRPTAIGEVLEKVVDLLPDARVHVSAVRELVYRGCGRCCRRCRRGERRCRG